MLIKHLLEDDNQENYRKIIERIAESKYFNEMYGMQLKTLEPEDLENDNLVNEFANIFRGSHKYTTPYLVITPYSENRIPTDTNIEIHKYVNMLSSEKFGVPIRNLIFADKNIKTASEYGNPYVLFPLGDYRLFYSENVKDFTAHYNTDSDMIFFIVNEVLLQFQDTYDEMIMESLTDTFERYEFDFKNLKTFDKSLKKLARKMASEYYNDPEGISNYKQSDVKILEKRFYEYGKKIFKQFNNYVNSIEVTQSIHDIDIEEIMIQADEIAAVYTENFNDFLSEVLKIKKGS